MRESSQISSVRKILRVIELLATSNPMGVRDIARTLNMAPSSTFRILNDAIEEEFIEKMNDGQYSVTPKILHLAHKMQKNMKLLVVARPYLEKLAESAGCTAFLGVMRQEQIVYILQVQADSTLQLNIEIGTHRPMYCTGLGKAVLAYLPEEKLYQILSAPLIKMTEKTFVDKDLLKLELDRTKARGYAIDDEEIIPGIKCIAAPIFDINGNVIASISISGHKEKFTESFIKEFSEKIVASAQTISSYLGYHR